MQNVTDERVSPEREQEAFRVMFEQAGFGVAQVSLEGQWLAVNQSLCDILGYPRSKLLGQTFHEVTRFDGIEAELADCRRLQAGTIQSFSSQKRHLRGDGRVVWLKATITLVRDDSTGEPSSYLGIVEDLTAQKKAVQQIQHDSDKRFRGLADSISDLFFTLDTDLKCTYWNRAAELLSGVSSREILSKSAGKVFSNGTNPDGGDDIYREVLLTQQARSFTFGCKIAQKDFVLEVTAYPSKEGISVVARDVAAKREAEAALRRLAAIVQFNDDAILSVTLDGAIASWNLGAEKLYGYSSHEILGKNVSLLVPLHLRQEGEFVRGGGLLSRGVDGFETQRLRKDGSLVDVALSISPILDVDGSIAGVSSIARDISERKRAEAALRRKVAFDHLMTRVLTRFTTCKSSEVGSNVIYALQQTGEFIGVDHAYVLLFSPDRTTWSATHEWHGPEVQPQTRNYRNIQVGSVPWSESRILAGEVVRIGKAEEFPDEAFVERNLPDVKAGQQSVLLVPIRGAAGVIAGAVGFDSHARPVTWSDDDVSYCKLVGDAIASVLERKRAEEALRNSEEKFAKAFEASPAIITIIQTSDRRYLEVNRAFEQHTGFLRTEILGRSITDVGRSTDLQSLSHAFETVIAHGSVRNMEVRFRRKNGEPLIVLLSAEIVDFDGRPCVLTVAEDITERKQAEDALRESEERFRVMADSAPIMMWMAGTEKGCTDFNRGWLEFTGRSVAEEIGDGWAVGVHPADLPNCITTYESAFDQRRPFTMEYRLRRHDGEYRWITDTGVPRFLPDGSFVGYIGCCVDVDDQKQAELARVDLSRRLMTAQEAERTRIARELHDGIGQALALLGIQMQRAGQPDSLRVGKKNPGMVELCAKLKEIGTQVSQLSHQLHSSELEFLGLAVAVKSLCREFSEQYRIEVECTCTDIPADLDNDIALCFLRVIQEALHNIAKHSGASSVRVELECGGDDMKLTVADNGIGFEISEIRNSVGLGMVSMRERMHLIGGEFTPSSKPGSGTTIRARAPLPLSAS